MTKASLRLECLCAFGGVSIECDDGCIRAVSADGALALECVLEGKLLEALRDIEERTFPSDALRVSLALQAMLLNGATWRTVRSPQWWLDAFAEAVEIDLDAYKHSLESTASFGKAFEAYAVSFDAEPTHLDAWPDADALEALRLRLLRDA
jgi:hypothetical protein